MQEASKWSPLPGCVFELVRGGAQRKTHLRFMMLEKICHLVTIAEVETSGLQAFESVFGFGIFVVLRNISPLVMREIC